MFLNGSNVLHRFFSADRITFWAYVNDIANNIPNSLSSVCSGAFFWCYQACYAPG